MWLLDVNLPTGLLALLRGYSITCDTTANRGWRDLTNGLLAETAFAAGFHVILTRDRLFGESASRALRRCALENPERRLHIGSADSRGSAFRQRARRRHERPWVR